MNTFEGLSAAFLAGCAGSLLFTPLASKWAARLGAVDSPDGRRKNQAQPVPLGGGLAIAIAGFVGLMTAVALTGHLPRVHEEGLMLSALPSAVVLIIVGLIDDTIGLTGIYKLMGQMLAASLLVASGYRFDEISLFGLHLSLGDFGIPFSIFFCLGIINAFNLVDGADGLAASIGVVVCLTLGVIAAAQGMSISSVACMAMAGALLGFLRYNAPPARVYLGDTGSMLIGWLVAAVAIRNSIKEQAAVALTVPIAICAIPIIDAGAALIRRITTGQSVFTPDRGHLHHALLLRGWSVGQTAAMAAGLTVITCGGAVISYATRNETFAVVTAVGVFVVLVVTRVFGHSEVVLVASQVKSLTRGLLSSVRPPGSTDPHRSDQAIQIQGRRQWNVLWAGLREAAPVYNLAGLKLNVNIPHLHESFYATWKRPGVQTSEDAWRLTLPLSYGDRPVGKLSILGASGGSQGVMEMQQLLDFLEPLEADIGRIVEEAAVQLGTPSSVSPPRAAADLLPRGASSPPIAVSR